MAKACKTACGSLRQRMKPERDHLQKWASRRVQRSSSLEAQRLFWPDLHDRSAATLTWNMHSNCSGKESLWTMISTLSLSCLGPIKPPQLYFDVPNPFRSSYLKKPLRGPVRVSVNFHPWSPVLCGKRSILRLPAGSLTLLVFSSFRLILLTRQAYSLTLALPFEGDFQDVERYMTRSGHVSSGKN